MPLVARQYQKRERSLMNSVQVRLLFCVCLNFSDVCELSSNWPCPCETVRATLLAQSDVAWAFPALQNYIVKRGEECADCRLFGLTEVCVADSMDMVKINLHQAHTHSWNTHTHTYRFVAAAVNRKSRELALIPQSATISVAALAGRSINTPGWVKVGVHGSNFGYGSIFLPKFSLCMGTTKLILLNFSPIFFPLQPWQKYLLGSEICWISHKSEQQYHTCTDKIKSVLYWTKIVK